jgi:protease IV
MEARVSETTQIDAGQGRTGAPDLENSLEAVMSRRSLRASRRRWRIFAILGLAIAAVALTGRFLGAFGENNAVAHIALVEISDVIAPDAGRRAALRRIAENDAIEAVIVEIDSPGGATAGGEELYEALNAIRELRPVVAVINQTGASAAYMTAVAAERIYARRLSIVGSIGVLYNHVDASKLLETIGVDFDAVASGPLKARPRADEALSGDIRASLQALVDDAFGWFVGIVAERRGMDRQDVLALAEGQIMTGQMAMEVGLIDAIGGRFEAIDWLEAEKGLTEDLPIISYYPPPADYLTGLRRVISEAVTGAIGGGTLGLVPLDGLVSVWQP